MYVFIVIISVGNFNKMNIINCDNGGSIKAHIIQIRKLETTYVNTTSAKRNKKLEYT